MMRLFAIALCLLISIPASSQEGEIDLNASIMRFIRAFGGDNEMAPPIVLIGDADSDDRLGSSYATVSFDLRASVIPNIYARIVHCQADWSDDDSFINSTLNRTSLVEWSIAPQRSQYYTYRGKIKIPNPQIDLRYSGNYKIKIFDMRDDRFLGETRIFVVEPQAFCRFNFMTDFYEPKASVSAIALTLEAIIDSPRQQLFDANMHSVVFYRNHRWNEPFVVSRRFSEVNPSGIGTSVQGIFPAGKIFRVSRLPAQNEYRILDLTNLALFPFTGQPVRLPFSDQRRNGMFFERANDGAMVTAMVSSYNDEYVPIEFLLDPQPGRPSVHDVFLSGSFNNWNPNRSWMMSFDQTLGMYRLRQWVRRGRHNYLYATGSLNFDTGVIRDLAYEEWEGNTASNSNSYIAFAYYTVQEYGGYDGIIAVGASNIYQSGR